MEQGEPPGGAVETLALNSDIKENNGPVQSPGPTKVQTQNQTTDLDQTSVTSSCQSTVVRVSAVDLFKAQNLIEISSETPGPSPVMVLTQDPNPEQRPDQEPEQKLEQEPDQELGERLEQEPNQKPSLVQNNRDMSPDSLQIKPSSEQSPAQTPSQSIVVRVSAMALFQALAKNPGQNQVRIPLVQTMAEVHNQTGSQPRTQGPNAAVVLAPHPGPGVVLGAGLFPDPGLVSGPGPVPGRGPSLVRVRGPGLGSGLVRVRGPGVGSGVVRGPGPGPVQKQLRFRFPGIVQIRPRILTPTEVQAPVSVPVLDSQLQTKNRDQDPDQDSDQDPDLVSIPLPPEAVRPLSPSPITTPLKPLVPPRGFRLNGRLIPLLPGMDGVVVFLRSRPRGSQSGLTSLCVMDAPPTRKRRVPRINSMQAPPLKRRTPPPSKEVRPPRKKKASSSAPGTGAMVTLPPVPCAPLKPRPQKCKVPTLLQKDVLVQPPPPDCYRCRSHFRPAPELRGFVCLCSQDLSEGLASLRLKRKEDRLRIKLKKLNVLNQRLRATRPEGYSPAASKSPSSLQKPLGNPIHFLSEPRPPVSPGVMRPHLPVSPATTRPCPSVSPATKRPRPSVSLATTRPRPSVSPATTRPRPSVSPATTRPRPSVSPATTRPRPSVSPATTMPRPFVGPGVLRPLPPQQESSAGPSPSDKCSSVGGASGLSVGGATGRLVIRLEDFYYGSLEGYVGAQKRLVMRYKCLNCPKHLRGNIRLMHHMMDHVTDLQELVCPYCLRQIVPQSNLQLHLQAVHGPNSSRSTVVCQICERVFETEIALLLHMKSTHKPGEMPYCCELCGFRSSFFSLLWTHFEEVHSNTLNFLCHFCLRVMKKHCAYQAHVARHQKNQIYSCYRCRLHFLTAKERQDHLELLHRTHVKPDQLSGLRPGTVVTVRTFQEVSPEAPLILEKEEEQRRSTTVMKRRVKTCKRKAVESLGKLLDHLQSSSGSCVECLTPVQNFQNHFPALVRCSRCVFQTCCSRAYANHMINNHSSVNRKLLYPCVFTSCPRSGGLLECVTCGFSSHTGDTMALHLMKSPKHVCLSLSEELSTDEGAESEGVGGARGVFVPIEHLQSSSNLSINALNGPAYLSSPAAMTITIRSPTPKPAPVLSLARLSVLFDALLRGTSWASKHAGVSPAMIGQWKREQKRSLNNRSWRLDTSLAARYVLTERELNRAINKDAILDLSRRTLGPKSSQLTRLAWAVDFLLRHDLGLDSRSKELRSIGLSVIDVTWWRVRCLSIPPQRFSCLDEFPLFWDPGSSSLSPGGLRVWGERGERPLLEVMLCACSDGTLLRPLLFYCGTVPSLPPDFPSNILLRGQEGGLSVREKSELWAREVWSPHLGFSSVPSLLLLDKHCGHVTEDFREPLSFTCTELVHFPFGCGSIVQPLDQCLVPVLRTFIQDRWAQLVSGPSLFSDSDLVLTLCCWFSEVCHILKTNKDFLHKSFLGVGSKLKNAEFRIESLNQELYHALTTPTTHCTSQSEETTLATPTTHCTSQSEERTLATPTTHCTSQSEERTLATPTTHCTSQSEERTLAMPTTHCTTQSEERTLAMPTTHCTTQSEERTLATPTTHCTSQSEERTLATPTTHCTGQSEDGTLMTSPLECTDQSEEETLSEFALQLEEDTEMEVDQSELLNGSKEAELNTDN